MIDLRGICIYILFLSWQVMVYCRFLGSTIFRAKMLFSFLFFHSFLSESPPMYPLILAFVRIVKLLSWVWKLASYWISFYILSFVGIIDYFMVCSRGRSIEYP